jgi:FkbM family methyltransferase
MSSLDLARLAADPSCMIREAHAGWAPGAAFYLRGAGQVGRKMLAALKADGRPVKGFLDNNPALAGQAIDGAPILSFDQVKPAPNDICVVTIWSYRHDFRRSAAEAHAMGFQRVMHFSALATLLGYEAIFPNYAVDHPSTVFTPEIEADHAALMAGLADDASRDLANQVLAFHALPAPENLPAVSHRSLPFDPGAIETYVDCGAFIGDDFAERRGVFDHLKTAYLIEPDPATFATLSARTFEGLDVIPVHAAASDREGEVRFAANGDWGSKVVETQSTARTVKVQTLTLDSLPLNPAARTYVKMDVESHELAALAGAHALLSDNQTVFGVTLEHKARDLFDIPRLFARYPHRRTYLFAHDTEFAMDLVAYSVPAD